MGNRYSFCCCRCFTCACQTHRGVSHQTCGWHALVDDVWLHRFLHQRLAALASPLTPDVAMNKELCRNDVQALAHVFTDSHHGLTASTCRVLWFMVVLHPLEVFGQGLALWLTTCVGVCSVARLLGSGLQRSELGFQVRLVGCQGFFKPPCVRLVVASKKYSFRSTD